EGPRQAVGHQQARPRREVDVQGLQRRGRVRDRGGRGHPRSGRRHAQEAVGGDLMPTHHYADVNGQRLHYASEGKGPLIMFVHGFPEFWYAWRGQLAEFGRDHQAVALDMRGYNLSSKPKEVSDYAVPLLVEDLAALADHLGAKKFTLVAHDWGGGVAWAFALTKPERLERLVIVNAPHPAIFRRLLAENPDQQKASQYMLTFRSAEAEGMLSKDNL